MYIYPCESGDGVCAKTETLMKRPRRYQRPLHLNSQLLRDVAERHQFTGPIADASEIPLVEHILAVEQSEHSQQQRREEAVQHAVEVQLAAAEVRAEIVEQFREDLGVLLVQDAVRPREHVVKFTTGAVDQFQA